MLNFNLKMIAAETEVIDNLRTLRSNKNVNLADICTYQTLATNY